MANTTGLLVLLAAVLACSVSAQNLTTKGMRKFGYEFASDVTGYVNMTIDYCDIRGAVESGNNTLAEAIYLTGKNSRSGAGFRAFLRFASHVPTTPESSYNVLAMGRTGTNGTAWLSDKITAAFAAGDGATALGLIRVAGIKYMLHEVDAACDKIVMYEADPVNMTLYIDDDSGAPHNVDEGAALWFSFNDVDCGTPAYEQALLSTATGTTFLGDSVLNGAMSQLYQDLLAAARAGDSSTMNATREAMWKVLVVHALQGTVSSLYTAELTSKCSKSLSTQQAAMMPPASDVKAWAAAHFELLEPLLMANDVDPSPMKALFSASGIPKYKKQVLPLATRVMSALGLEASDVGQPKFKKINVWGCPESARP